MFLVYFTADLHLGGSKRYKHFARPFANYKVYEDAVMNNFIKTLSSKDILYMVGDTLDYKAGITTMNDIEGAASLLSQLPCTIQFLIGNNEEFLLSSEFENDVNKLRVLIPFVDNIRHNCMVKVGNNVFNLVHKPKYAANKVINLVGHIHTEFGLFRRSINVGVDMCGYYPMSTEMLYYRIYRAVVDLTGKCENHPFAKNFDVELLKQYLNNWHPVP